MEIPGLTFVPLTVQRDEDGWFAEAWNEARMSVLGLRHFRPVQHNVRHFHRSGITRGLYAEPWDRLITVVRGRAFGAWVDLRPGESYGAVVTAELDADTAVFVPRGVANSVQILEDDTTLTTLLDQHWTPEARARYSTVNLFDPALDIPWPIPERRATVSPDDAANPMLADAVPFRVAGRREQPAVDAQRGARGTDPGPVGDGGDADGSFGSGGSGRSGGSSGSGDAQRGFGRWADAAPRREEADSPAAPSSPRRRAYKVLFVCTANICRSAYADVAANAVAPAGVQFSSAGTRALVGEGIDPPMAQELKVDGEPGAHRARQVTRDLVEDADLILTMAGEHRRYLLDEWPAAGRKTYVIGHASRVLAELPGDVTLEGLAGHLWSNRTVQEGDEVRDPYRRGQEAASVAAREIDGHLSVVVGVLETLVSRR
ncbi:dTDP-4-dehydrorhamnose 3,5-epimerase family protein [Tessaracoccus sp. Y1736]